MEGGEKQPCSTHFLDTNQEFNLQTSCYIVSMSLSFNYFLIKYWKELIKRNVIKEVFKVLFGKKRIYIKGLAYDLKKR